MNANKATIFELFDLFHPFINLTIIQSLRSYTVSKL